MSFEVTNVIGSDRKKHTVYFKTHFSAATGRDSVIIGVDDGPLLDIDVKDFLAAAEYVITNPDLKKNDHRYLFIKCMKRMRQVIGWNPGNKRLQSSINAT